MFAENNFRDYHSVLYNAIGFNKNNKIESVFITAKMCPGSGFIEHFQNVVFFPNFGYATVMNTKNIIFQQKNELFRNIFISQKPIYK